MMLLSLSLFRFWKWSWSRSCLKWLTDVGLPRLGWPSRPGSGSQPLARSRQQLQQSRPMGERHSSFDIRSSSPTWESDLAVTGSPPPAPRWSSSTPLFLSSTFCDQVCQVPQEKKLLWSSSTACVRVCVSTHATQVFMSRGCLLSRNDAAGMRWKEKNRSCLFFFFWLSPAPDFFLPLCVHTVQTAREEVEGWRRGLERREEESLWLVKHAEQFTKRSRLLSPQQHNQGGAKLGRE